VIASLQTLPAILDGRQLVEDFGLPLLLFIVFAETGLLLGFFLPGDSLLVLAGAYCATKAGSGEPHLNLFTVLVGVAELRGTEGTTPYPEDVETALTAARAVSHELESLSLETLRHWEDRYARHLPTPLR